MASINLSGVLRDPIGELSSKNKIRFTHNTTTGQTVRGFSSVFEIDADGAYDIDLEYGNVLIETFDAINKRWTSHGVLTINSDTPATDIPTLLGITTPATNAQLLVFQALVADAETAQTAAETAQTAAETAQTAAEAVGTTDIQAIARSLNVANSDVIYATDTVTVLDNVKYIYDSTAQSLYSKPSSVGASETIISLTAYTLTTNSNTYDISKVSTHNRYVNIKDFGAIGDGATDDTSAIDLAFSYIDANGGRDGASENGARSILLQVDGPVLYFPAGEYVYSGAGYIPSNNKVIIVKGDSPSSSTIRITSDSHFINPQSSSQVMAYVELADLKFVGGRGAFFNEKEDVGNVAHGKRVYNCVFAGYTSVAFGSTQEEDARWVIKNSFFEGGDTGTPAGLLLPHEIAEPEIGGCNSFAGNKYDIICSDQGISELVIGPSNNFFNLSGRPKEADIWLQPGGISQGLGVRFIGNRHSNENLDVTDPNFLIADRDGATASHVFQHLTTISTESFNGLTVSQCSLNSTGNPSTSSDARGYILSFTPNVGGLRFTDNILGQWRPWVIEYAAAITKEQVDAGGCVTNYVKLTTSRKTVNVYDIIGISNIQGAGLVEYDNMFAGGLAGGIHTYSDGTVNLTKIIDSSDPNTYSKGTNVTASPLTDVAGGALATSFTFGADEAVVIPIDYASVEKGRVFWLEADVKGTTTEALSAINLRYTIRGKAIYYQVALTEYWQRIRIPLITVSDSHTSGTIDISFLPNLFLDIGVKDSFGLGRVAMYHQQGPVDFSLTEV